MNRHFVEHGATELEAWIHSRMPLYIKQSHSRHHIPRAQLALVLILPKTISVKGFRAIKLITYGPGPFLC